MRMWRKFCRMIRFIINFIKVVIILAVLLISIGFSLVYNLFLICELYFKMGLKQVIKKYNIKKNSNVINQQTKKSKETC